MNSTEISPIGDFFPRVEDLNGCQIVDSTQMNSERWDGMLSPIHYQDDSVCLPPQLCVNEVENDQSHNLPVDELGTE